VAEGRHLFSGLTVRENLEMGAYARGREHVVESLALVHEFFPVLATRTAQRAGTLSGGEQQMLAVGRALMSRPRLLMLDEPSLGLAPMLVTTLFEVVAQIRKTGITILLVEQNAKQALKLADRAYVLENGVVVLDGAAEDLADDPRVRRAYLGTEA
jgi:branched-chain amino acid transport system ATP-binding protein